MSQNRQWCPIDECITSYMDEAEISNHKYYKLWHLCFRAMTELGIDAFYAIRCVKILVNSNLTATLPADYLQYSKVGVLNQQGEIIPLGFNNKLTLAYDLNPTRLEQTQDNSIPTQLNQQGVWWYNYWNGQGFSNLYGYPSGNPQIGSFKIDNANGVIVLSENFSYPYIMLEYIPSPKEGEEYYVPVQFKEAVIAYLRWKDKISIPAKTHMDNSNIAMRRHDFYNERSLAIRRYDPINLPDLYEWNLQNQRLAIKT